MTAEPIGTQPPPEQTDAAATARPGLPPVSKWFMFVYTLTNFGLSLVILMPILFSLAYKIQIVDPGSKESSLGLVMGIGAVVLIIAGPVIGSLSDRTRLAWGRRRPYLVLGIAINAAGSLVIAMASSITVILLGWVVAVIGGSFAGTAVSPVIAERVPEQQRGKLGAYAGISGQMAGVAASLVGSLLVNHQVVLFLLPVMVLTAIAGLFFVTVPDQPAPPDAPSGTALQFFKDLAFNPFKHRDFSLVLIGKFLFQLGLNFFTTYQLYFLLDRLELSPAEAGQKLALLGGIGIVVGTASAVVSGMISDRIGRRKPFIYGAAASTTAGLLVASAADGIALYSVGAILLTLGVGMFGTVDVALVSDAMPERETQAGKYMSIYYNLAANPAGAIAPLLAPLVLGIGGGGNYAALFITAAFMSLGAGFTAWRIRSVK